MRRKQLMRFNVPIELSDLSGFGIGARAIIPLYINPENTQFTDKKLISKQLTKGGFSIQYWGEDLTVLTASGTTGSGGIEAANILRDVYRHEQIQMNRILLARAAEARLAAKAAIIESDAPADTFYSLADELTGGALSQIVDGVESIIDSVTGAINQDLNTEVIEKIILTPTPAALATSIDLYFGGEKYRGYFDSFQISEAGQAPGIVNYQFTFTITRRWGRRTNYMPWHRNPLGADGRPVPASPPLQGAAEEELTFPTNVRSSTQQSLTDPNLRSKKDVSNRFVSDELSPDVNAVPLNRSGSIK